MDQGSTDGTTGTASPRSRKQAVARIGKHALLGTAIAAAAVVVTLYATKREAQRENFLAYLNGLRDGLSQGDFLDGWDAAMEWLTEALASEWSATDALRAA
jgi:hypothetical protein